MAAKSNPNLVQLVADLRRTSKEEAAPIWRAVADRVEGPLRNRPEVNLSRIERYAKPQEVLVVPGKLLGSGQISKAVTVAALQASASARRKVEGAGGRVVTIRELVRGNPKGKGVRIMG